MEAAIIPTTQIKSMKGLLSREDFDLPKAGQILMGEIISVSKSNVFLDFGPIGIGIVYPGQFYDNPERMKALQKGDKVSSIIVELENEEGYRELSLKAAQLTTAWEDIKEKMEKGELISTKIININKGGLIVEVNGVQGFLPLSQLSSEHYPKVEGGDTTKIVQVLQKFKGQSFMVKIVNLDMGTGRVFLSLKALKEDPWIKAEDKYQVGQKITGKILKIKQNGVF